MCMCFFSVVVVVCDDVHVDYGNIPQTVENTSKTSKQREKDRAKKSIIPALLQICTFLFVCFFPARYSKSVRLNSLVFFIIMIMYAFASFFEHILCMRLAETILLTSLVNLIP